MPEPANDDFFLDDLPDHVQATVEARDRAFAALGSAAGGLEALVDRLRRWVPGSTVRVAFLGGSTALHRDIAAVAGEISSHCNLTLDFGESNGTFRTWSENDQNHAAEIRVSFDQKGFFSLVGTDSTAVNIGAPSEKVGGRPFQRSLNLGGFHIQRPATFRGTVLHEFLHALAFHHEHANFRGPCQEAFRFEDDPGYQPTTDNRGVFVTDSRGRRPGIYTFLSGAPNFWSRAKVDHNLRAVSGPGIEASAFDRNSVMLYRFPPLFYRTPNSDCAPGSDGQSLSEGDRAGLRSLYPEDDSGVEAVVSSKRAILAGFRAQIAPAPGAPVHALAAHVDTAGPAASRTALEAAVESLSRQLER